MNYDVITLACERLGYRDKLKLAQLLIQTARMEEENTHPTSKITVFAENDEVIKSQVQSKSRVDSKVVNYDYAVKRILKLRPTKKTSLFNSINAMFQFQGGISDKEVNKIIAKLQQNKDLYITNNKVSYDK